MEPPQVSLCTGGGKPGARAIRAQRDFYNTMSPVDSRTGEVMGIIADYIWQAYNCGYISRDAFIEQETRPASSRSLLTLLAGFLLDAWLKVCDTNRS